MGDFLDKLDKNDNGKTKAALPTSISPSKIELTEMDVPGLVDRWERRKIKYDHPMHSSMHKSDK